MRKLGLLTAAAALVAVLGVSGTAWAQFVFPFDGDLVAYYSFDASNGGADATDDSSNGNDGTVTGAAADCADTPPTPGNSCSLDFEADNSDSVDAGNDASLHVSSGDFTVAAWVNFESLSDRSIVDKMKDTPTSNADGWRLLKQNDNKFWFCFGGGGSNGCTAAVDTTVISTTSPTIGTWIHVAAVKDGSDIEIFVNGTSEDSDTMTGFTDSNTTDLLIGENDKEGAFMDGKIDEVRIYDVALSADEIADLAAVFDISVEKTLQSGPLDGDGDPLVDVDLDGDVDVDDEGPRIGIGLDESQHYVFTIKLTNNGDDEVLDGGVVFDVLPAEYDLDKDAEDFDNDSTVNDDCADGICDGVASDSADCVVTPSRAPGANKKGKDKLEPEFLTIEVDSFDNGDMCTITVWVNTDVNPGKHTPDIFEPTSCAFFEDAGESEILDDSGKPIHDWIALNDGVKVFHPINGDLVIGPTGSIQLNPLCDFDEDGVVDELDDCPLEGPPDLGIGETLGADGCIIGP